LQLRHHDSCLAHQLLKLGGIGDIEEGWGDNVERRRRKFPFLVKLEREMARHNEIVLAKHTYILLVCNYKNALSFDRSCSDTVT